MNSSKKIHQEIDTDNVFQRSFYDRVIRNREEYEKISKYIYENPMNWEKDDLYTNWTRNEIFRVFSSVTQYAPNETVTEKMNETRRGDSRIDRNTIRTQQNGSFVNDPYGN